MVKKVFLMLIFFAFIAKGTAQIEVHSSNQVGIGTTNPQHKLHVVGDAFVSGNFYLGSASKFLGTMGNYPVMFKVNNIHSGSTGSDGNTSVSFGYEALPNIPLYATSGNTAVGYRTLFNNTTFAYTSGIKNTAIGSFALYTNTTGFYNTAIGAEALYSNTTGNYNNAFGHASLYYNTIGNGNTAIGTYSLWLNTTGSYNFALGPDALSGNTTGSGNTAIGYGALNTNTIGGYNFALGSFSGYGITGNNNVAIGTYTLFSSYGIPEINNSTAIGYGAMVGGSNQVIIGNNTVTSIGGYVAWSNYSDGRMKKNIRRDVPGLAFIKSLQPVTYNMDLDAVDKLFKRPNESVTDSVFPPKSEKMIEAEKKAREAKEKITQTGFIAQDVEKAAKEVGYDFSGVDVDEAGIYSLRYSEFVVPLVKAVHELCEQNERLQKQVEELNKRLEKLEPK